VGLLLPIWAAAQPRLLFLLAKEEKEAKRRTAKILRYCKFFPKLCGSAAPDF
jgi:hypothetical protein